MKKDLDIDKRIKDIRMKKNLSQKRFGFKIGKSGKTISAYESGRCTPTLKVLDSISQVYDVTFIHTKKNKKFELEKRINNIRGAIKEIESTFLDDIKSSE